MNTLVPQKNFSQRILYLDYLRIFAFLSVVAGHKFYLHLTEMLENDAVHATPKIFIELILPLIHGGGAGVVVFFLVSGYIITQILQSESPLDFAIKRIFRIYPLYIVAVIAEVMLHGHVPSLDLIPQLLLIGDFFHTPYTLGGVEWTLRLEVLFYIFMGALRYFKVFDQHKHLTPWIFVAAAALLGLLVAPFPDIDLWSRGYVTIYGPFLFIGVFVYFLEHKSIGIMFFSLFTIGVLAQYYYLISQYQSDWLNDHFATLSVIIFLVAWYFRNACVPKPVILLLSDLTYSVYLFHNWAWASIKGVFDKLSISILHEDIQAFIALLVFCYIMLNIVEKPSIRCGRVVLAWLKATINRP